MTHPAVESEVDVAVVGAGIIGVAAASFLQDDGRDVLLIDRGEPAHGASFGNAGAFAFSDILPLASPGIMRKAPRWLVDPLGPLTIPPAYLPQILPWLIRFWRASRPDRVRGVMVAQAAMMRFASQEMARLVVSADLGGMVRADGSLELYESEAELAASLSGWTAREKQSIAFEHVRGAVMADLQPGLSPRFVAGTFVPGWKTVSDPYDFASALAARVIRRGGRIARQDVAGMRPVEGGVALDCRDGSTIMARQAVIACGAWSKPLARALGDDVPLETERGYNTTLPLEAFDIRRQLIFGGHGFVITPLSSGIRVGGAVELGGLARAPNFARSEAMLRKAADFLPGLKTGGGRQWMGFRPSLPDSLPVIGPSRAARTIIYAFGHGHLGLTQSAGTGRLVADLVAGRAPALDISPFSPQRFQSIFERSGNRFA
ncbi:D-amino acid dehydrogenase small subunit [Hyphomicrobiales bacterium]|nr:D-amino acid dehydrogenase small subunit [Hyphomicrobiales bacterium]CAH1673006.1 D-amino acid dehydrogenase small subunit [Hyphomicrobiales bacterium]